MSAGRNSSSQDSRHWGSLVNNLTAKRRKAPIVNAQINEFIAKHTNHRALGEDALKNQDQIVNEGQTLAQISHVRLTRLEMIGIKCHSDKYDFEWPKAREIVHLRYEKVVLTQVRLIGSSSLEGI